MMDGMSNKLGSISFKKNEIIFQEGDKADHAYLVSKGKVEIYREHRGKRLTLEHLTSGKLFGEMALLTGDLRSASALACQETTLVVLDQEVLDNQLDKTSPYLRMLMHSLIKRVKFADAKFIRRNTEDPVLTVARLLLSLSQADHSPDFGIQQLRLKKETLRHAHMTDAEFDSALALLVDNGLIDRQAFHGRKFLVVHKPDLFLRDARKISKQFSEYSDITINQSQFADMHDAAAARDCSTAAMIKDIANSVIDPADILLHIEGTVAQLKKS